MFFQKRIPAMRSMISMLTLPSSCQTLKMSMMLSQQQHVFGFATARAAAAGTTKKTAKTTKKGSKSQRVLVTGCSGQIGKALAPLLCQKYGQKNVLLTDLVTPTQNLGADFIKLNVANQKSFFKIAEDFQPTKIIHLAALLSVSAQQNPQKAFEINTKGFHNALEVAKQMNAMIYSPSSMAVYGKCAPKNKVAVASSLRPNTLYGITKVENQLMGLYYRDNFDVDYRAIRYVGIMSPEEQAFHGTTDYSSGQLDMIWKAANGESKYQACLEKGRKLSMMYIDDALDATMKLIEAPKKSIKSAIYNLNGVSASPQDFTKALQKKYKSLKVSYKPTFRDQIAKTWPASFEDSSTKEFGWSYKATVPQLVKQMLKGIKEQQNQASQLEQKPSKKASSKQTSTSSKGRKSKVQNDQTKKTTTKKQTSTSTRGRKPKAQKEQTKKTTAKKQTSTSTRGRKPKAQKEQQTSTSTRGRKPKAQKEQTKKTTAKKQTSTSTRGRKPKAQKEQQTSISTRGRKPKAQKEQTKKTTAKKQTSTSTRGRKPKAQKEQTKKTTAKKQTSTSTRGRKAKAQKEQTKKTTARSKSPSKKTATSEKKAPKKTAPIEKKVAKKTTKKAKA